MFIRVSLTDPNMRRWLSWIQKLKEAEVVENEILSDAKAKNSFSHYWINQKPVDDQEIVWIENCVRHLGVMVIWLDNWNELEDTFKIMIE